jgi:hypothetical protein
MGSFKEILFSLIIVGLFFYLIVSFGVQLGVDNGANNTLLENPVFNLSFQGMQTNLTEIISTSNDSRAAFEKDNVLLSFGDLIFFSIVGVGKIITNSIVAFFNIIGTVGTQNLGIDPLVIGVFGAMILISLVIYLWRLYKTGE